MRKPVMHVGALLAVLFFATLYVSAQNTMHIDSTQHRKLVIREEAGVQANYFLRQFIKPGSTDSITNPYYLSYKIYLMPYNIGIRAGVEYNYLRSEIDVIDEAKLNITRAFNLRLGLEKRFKLSKRFAAFAGADYVYSSSKNDFSTYNTIEVVTNKTVAYQRGGGPVAGLSYRINKHISLMTETSLYYMSGVATTSTDYSINITNNVSFDQKMESLVWRAPNAIFCCVNF